MQSRFGIGRLFSLGTQEEGLEHWWSSRLTSLLLIPFSVGFLWVFIPLLGASFETVQERLASPFKGILVILFLLVATKHLIEGNQVILEDYVHDDETRERLLKINFYVFWAFGCVGVLSVLKLVFGI